MTVRRQPDERIVGICGAIVAQRSGGPRHAVASHSAPALGLSLGSERLVRAEPVFDRLLSESQEGALP